MSQMQLQGQRSDQKEGERGEQGEAVGGPDGLYAEDTLQRSEDERAGNQSREEGIKNDEDAPLELDLVGIHEAFDGNLHEPPFLGCYGETSSLRDSVPLYCRPPLGWRVIHSIAANGPGRMRPGLRV